MTEQIKFIQGNEVIVEGAMYAGLDFFAGYPITPSTEIAEQLSARLPQKGGKFIQMEDEIGAMAAVLGASWGGVKSMTATSGPGFSLMMENLGLAICTDVEPGPWSYALCDDAGSGIDRIAATAPCSVRPATPPGARRATASWTSPARRAMPCSRAGATNPSRRWT